MGPSLKCDVRLMLVGRLTTGAGTCGICVAEVAMMIGLTLPMCDVFSISLYEKTPVGLPVVVRNRAVLSHKS